MRASVMTASEVFTGAEGEDTLEHRDLGEEVVEASRVGLEDLRMEDLNSILATWGKETEGRRRTPRSPFLTTWREPS